MKRRSRNGVTEKTPIQRRKVVIDKVVDLVQFIQRGSKDIEAKSEAIEIERLLQQRLEELENGKVVTA